MAILGRPKMMMMKTRVLRKMLIRRRGTRLKMERRKHQARMKRKLRLKKVATKRRGRHLLIHHTVLRRRKRKVQPSNLGAREYSVILHANSLINVSQ